MNIKNNFLVICINYHSYHEVVSFSKSLFLQENSENIKLIIIDNSGDFKDKENIVKTCYQSKHIKRIIIYYPSHNLGYFGGAWWGIQQYLKDFDLPEWTIVSNPDIQFAISDFFVKLLDYHQINPPAIIAPSIILESSGIDQNPYMSKRPSKLRMHFYKWFFRYYPSLIIYQSLSVLKEQVQNYLPKIRSKVNNRPISIYAPHGSFIVFHRSYFESGGTLAHGCFLFGEEIFVAETARRLNLNILYDPRLKVIHKGHASTNIFKSRYVLHYMREAAVYCADEFFS